MKRRFLAILTIFTLLLSMSAAFSLPIAAEVVESSYHSATQVMQYPDEEGYTVATAEELAALAGLVADGYDFDGATIYITADLDFSEYDTWTPIGYLHYQSGGTADAESYPFRGNINGLCHRFENIDLDMSGPFQSLFGYVEGATIENIILAEGEMRSDDYRLGALVCLLKNSVARNIESHLSLSSTSTIKNLNMGLFSLTYDVEIESVVVYGTIGDPNLNTAQQNGGISGCGYDTATTIRHSFVPATIYGNEVFQIGQRCVIENCPLVGSKEMPEADFLGGRAAWLLNTAGGTRAHSGLWNNSANGPTLSGDAPIYKAEAVALTTEGDEIGNFDLYVGAGEEIRFPAIEGYTFLDASLKDAPIPAGWKMPAADQELFLRYEPKTFSITYEFNGGTSSAELPSEYRMGKRVLLPMGDLLSKEGFCFAGWYQSADFSGHPLNEISPDFGDDFMLYAKWATPIEIATPEQLCALSEGDLLGCYALVADINLSGYDYAPIGTKEAPFYGSFNGNGYTISGLMIQSQQDYQGLFGYNAGYIENVTLSENCSVEGNCYVGALAGYNAGTIVNCISRATVSAINTSNKQYKLMSQNLCIWGNDYDIVSVEERQPWMVKRIEEQDPDFIGFQEGSPAWVEYLSEHITDTYTFMYQYREPEDHSSKESAPLAYKTADFDCLDSGVFWLSETPDECSKGWDAGHWRICHWMILQDKASGQKIGIYNTHFDLTDRSRKGAAQVIQARLQQAILEYPDMMILACGDFNTEAGTEPYEIMNSGGMVDSRYTAPITTDEYTHTKGAGWGEGERSIDHIFGYGERMIFDEFDVLNELSSGGNRLSDHNGVLAKFRSSRGRMVGGMIGGNHGTAKGLLMQGDVCGTDVVGLVIGEDTADADYLYAKSGSFSIKGSGKEAFHSGTDLQNDFNGLSFLWALNQAIGKDAFTLRDQKAALLGQRADEIPVKVTDRGAEKYALSGSLYQIDITGFQNPICFVDGEPIEGTSFIVPQKSCVVAVEESPVCPPHDYGPWQKFDENLHIHYCNYDANHKEVEDHHFDHGVYHEAGCTHKEYTRKTCQDCGYIKEEEGRKPALGHSYGEWTLLKEGSEEEQGMYGRQCGRCHEWEQRVIPCKSDPAIYGVLQEIDLEGIVTVDIMIRNNPGFAGFGMEVAYDIALLDPLEEGGVEYGEIIEGRMPFSYVDRDNGIIRIVSIATNMTNQDGRIATLKFKAKKGAEGTKLGLKCLPGNINDLDYQPVTIYEKDLIIEREPDHTHSYVWEEQQGIYECYHLFCMKVYDASDDMDGDGRLTTLDGILLLRHLMGGKQLDQHTADFNQDGKVAISDLIILLRLLNHII